MTTAHPNNIVNSLVRVIKSQQTPPAIAAGQSQPKAYSDRQILTKPARSVMQKARQAPTQCRTAGQSAIQPGVNRRGPTTIIKSPTSREPNHHVRSTHQQEMENHGAMRHAHPGNHHRPAPNTAKRLKPATRPPRHHTEPTKSSKKAALKLRPRATPNSKAKILKVHTPSKTAQPNPKLSAESYPRPPKTVAPFGYTTEKSARKLQAKRHQKKNSPTVAADRPNDSAPKKLRP